MKAQEKLELLERYRRRKAAVKRWIVVLMAARIMAWMWRAQWTLVFKTEAARQLNITQMGMARRMQKKWRERIAHRYCPPSMVHNTGTSS